MNMSTESDDKSENKSSFYQSKASSNYNPDIQLWSASSNKITNYEDDIQQDVQDLLKSPEKRSLQGNFKMKTTNKLGRQEWITDPPNIISISEISSADRWSDPLNNNRFDILLANSKLITLVAESPEICLLWVNRISKYIQNNIYLGINKILSNTSDLELKGNQFTPLVTLEENKNNLHQANTESSWVPLLSRSSSDETFSDGKNDAISMSDFYENCQVVQPSKEKQKVQNNKSKTHETSFKKLSQYTMSPTKVEIISIKKRHKNEISKLKEYYEKQIKLLTEKYKNQIHQMQREFDQKIEIISNKRAADKSVKMKRTKGDRINNTLPKASEDNLSKLSMEVEEIKHDVAFLKIQFQKFSNGNTNDKGESPKQYKAVLRQNVRSSTQPKRNPRQSKNK